MTHPPQILISADMEGVGGIVDSAECRPGDADYERSRDLMTAEVNAAVRGVLAAEPQARIVVADAHGPFRNIRPEKLHRRTRLIRGKPRSLAMMEGLRRAPVPAHGDAGGAGQAGVDAVILIGYHGRAGSASSVIAHTFSDAIGDVRVNGRSFGEIGLNTALAGTHGAPVLLLSGDNTAGAELRDLVPEATTVEVKRALGQYAASCLHPDEACEAIEAAVATTVANRTTVAPLRITGPVETEIDLGNPLIADHATLVPGVRRQSGRTVAFTAADYAEAYRLTRLVNLLGQVR
ncbi:MAG: M55 family metallopeptidase [Micromonosporaceae bacterium]